MSFNTVQKSLGKTVISFYKLPLINKIFIAFVILMFICIIRNRFNTRIDNFDNRERFSSKYGENSYDSYYVKHYDLIFLDERRNKFMLNDLINEPGDKNILDVGSGTGYNVNLLNNSKNNANIKVLGIDKSKEMTKYAKSLYPKSEFKTSDILQFDTINHDKFTHVICVNRTIYEIKNKSKFFDACIDALDYNGELIVDLVDKDDFKAYIVASNNKILHNPENYDSKINNVIVKFDKYNEYNSKYDMKKEDKSTTGNISVNMNNPNLTYYEEFKNFKNNKIRKNEIYLYIPEKKDIVNMAKEKGFIVERIKKLDKVGYKHEYLYTFKKTM